MEYVVVALIIAFVVGSYYFRIRLEGGESVGPSQQKASNQKFYMPDDRDLKPAIEYLTLAIPAGGNYCRMIIFSSDGVVEQREGISKSQRERIIAQGNWQYRAHRQLVVGGKSTNMHQYERPRLA